MDAGMAPARGLVSFVYVWFNTARTLQLIVLEVEVLQVREVADGRRDGACALACEYFVYVWFNTRTLQLVVREPKLRELCEVADGRWDGACEWAREFLCMSGSTHTHR